MDCLGPQCAQALMDWIKTQRDSQRETGESASVSSTPARQGSLFTSAPYQEEAPAIRSRTELAGAIEHLEYAIFRRYQNQLTKSERARLDNTIDNTLFKVDRYVAKLEDSTERARLESELSDMRSTVRNGREHVERMRSQAKRADLKLSQLHTLTPEGFEEFVAELFEAMGYVVERVGGSGDEGADLLVRKAGLVGVVQCKYYTKGVIGSPELQKFLGTIHHTRSHKGFFVTTRTFTLAAEKFVAEHPIELIDGPRLVELVQEALGPGARHPQEPVWF